LKKVLFISLAVVLALTIGLIGCEGEGPPGPVIPPEPDSVVVGMSRDVLGFFEMAGMGPVYRTYFAEVNNVSGGILLDEYGADFRVPIEVVRLDDGDDPAVSASNIDLLIDVHDVDFLLGGCGTSHIFAQAPVANLREYVLMTSEGGATDLKTALAGMPYVFVNLSFSDWYEIPVLAKILAEGQELDEPGVNATAYISFISEQHGTEYTQVSNTEFPANNIEIVKTVGHPYVTPDFSDVIAEAKALDVDIFCAYTYPWNVWAATQEAITQDFNPKAFVCGPGANFGLYGDPGTSGLNMTQIEGVMSFTTAAYGAKPEIDAVYDKLATTIEQEILPSHLWGLGIGMGFLDYWGHPLYWAALEMWQAAVEEVGYVSQDGLRDALIGKSASDPFDTILGDTWYTQFGSAGGGILAYECHTGEIGQWISGAFETIGYSGITSDLPRYIVTGAYNYPKPAFP
jgi:branched-chain amino acid transport system substrate-binding protein